jgi:hypothetical protein
MWPMVDTMGRGRGEGAESRRGLSSFSPRLRPLPCRSFGCTTTSQLWLFLGVLPPRLYVESFAQMTKASAMRTSMVSCGPVGKKRIGAKNANDCGIR